MNWFRKPSQSGTTLTKEQIQKIKLDQLEAKIFKSVGLISGENLKIYDVELGGREGHIHTVEAGFESGCKPKLVLLHGYGGSSISFWRIIARMSKDYHVYAIDQYGTGLSHRPDFKNQNYDEAVEIFTEAMEDWRLKLDIKDFYMLGHSFGGYTAVQYIKKKQPPIKQLFLLSPGGFTYKSKEEIDKAIKEKLKIAWHFKLLYRAVTFMVFERGYTPFYLMSWIGKKNLLKKYYSSGRLGLSEELAEDFTEYFNEFTNLKESTDRALSLFLYYGRYSKMPLCDTIVELQEQDRMPPTTVYYGTKDWMDFKHSRKMIQEKNIKIDFQMLEGVGHQVPFEDIDELVQNLGTHINNMESVKQKL